MALLPSEISAALYQEQFDLEILYAVEQPVQVPLVPDVADK